MSEDNFFRMTEPKKEVEPRSYETSFDTTHFAGEEKPIGTLDLVAQLNRWWAKICAEQAIDPLDKGLKNADYFLMELAKNALEYAGEGTVKVTFELNRIIVTVIDSKGWDGNPNNDILYGSPGHGLSSVKKFADEFIIETNGKKYAKFPKKRRLAETNDTEIQQGTKITFLKAINVDR